MLDITLGAARHLLNNGLVCVCKVFWRTDEAKTLCGSQKNTQ